MLTNATTTAALANHPVARPATTPAELSLATSAAQVPPAPTTPHHGGDTSLPELFPAVSPEVIAISVGQPNPYGHPDPTALAAAETTGAEIWRTDEHGTLTITWDEQGDPLVNGER